MRVGIAGLGRMGSAITAHLMDVGHDLTVWNRTPERAAPLADVATVADSVSAAVSGADVVITMGCGDACPLYPGKRYEDWEMADPAGLDVAGVRPIRDEIGKRVQALLEQVGIV